MIKINDRFEFERQEHCWNLYEWKDGINPKTKKPTRSKTVSYHANVMQICNEVIDREAGAAESVQEIIDVIGFASSDCEAAIARMTD